MTASALLATLRAQGLTFRVDEIGLRVGPKDAISGDQYRLIGAAKDELIALVWDPWSECWPWPTWNAAEWAELGRLVAHVQPGGGRRRDPIP